MKKNFAKRDRRGMVIYLSAISMLLAVLSFLFPFVGEASAEGEIFYFDSLKVVFGGDVEIVSKGYLYSYQFSFNLPFVVILFVALISIMAALAGRNSVQNTGICSLLSLATTIAFGFVPFIIASTNQSIVESSLIRGPGFYLAVIFGSLSFVISAIEFFFCLSYWRKKTAF